MRRAAWVLLALCLAAPAWADLSQRVGAGEPWLEIAIGAVDPASQDSHVTTTLRSHAPFPGERWRLLVAREDYVDPAYRFPADARAEEVAPAPLVTVDLGPQKRGSVYYLQAVRVRDGREVGRGPLEIRVPLIPARREAPRDEAAFAKSRKFREEIFRDFGFRPAAAEHIRATSSVEVLRFDTSSGGGGWAPWDRLVILDTAQREAAVHELAHVWWHDRRRTHPDERGALARDVVRLAGLDPARNPRHREAIEFARGYVHGIGDWEGMYPKVRDPRHLTAEDLEKRVLDWEIFAGFSSWTMGDLSRLPPFMARHFRELFTGRLRVVPYYRGGPP